MAKKKTTKKPKPKDTPTVVDFNIPTEEPSIRFSLGEEMIEGTILSFHRMSMQAEADTIDEHGQQTTGDEIIKTFARKLESEFDLKANFINDNMAYRIYETVFEEFNKTKKK